MRSRAQGLRAQHVALVELSQDERTKASRVAYADEGVGRLEQQRESARHGAHRVEDGVLAIALHRFGVEVKDDFGVARGAEDRAVLDELVSEKMGVDEISVVADGDLAKLALDVDGLVLESLFSPDVE